MNDPSLAPLDPVRRLMKMVAERQAKEAKPRAEVTEAQLTDDAQAAAETAAAVLAANPATGPLDVVYIGPNEDVADRRFMLLLFGGEAAFLFDRDAGQTTSVELDDRGLSGADRLRAKLDSAMAAAARERLAKLYVVKHP